MRKRKYGFTLVEMLLVIVIVSVILFAAIGYIQQRSQQMRVDRTASQMQQILNAGLAYYIANGTWPTNLDALRTGYYLPPISVPLNNPWGQPYAITQGPQPGVPSTFGAPPPILFAYTRIPGATDAVPVSAAAIAASLPISYTTADRPPVGGGPPPPLRACDASMSACYVVAAVNVPGQNLNNARAINFAGLYAHGGCIPIPQCPVDTNGNAMQPQVYVVPVSVSGFRRYSNTTTTPDVYPISSFTAYATGPSTATPTRPPACEGSFSRPTCSGSNMVGAPANAYWRACLQVITEDGNIQPQGNAWWGRDVVLMALTRCASSGEPAGSNMQIYSD